MIRPLGFDTIPVSSSTESVIRDAASAWTDRKATQKATCERDYCQAEVEFMQAMQEYKQASGRMFPTWSEVLEVLKALGYQKHA